jgi:integrase
LRYRHRIIGGRIVAHEPRRVAGSPCYHVRLRDLLTGRRRQLSTRTLSASAARRGAEELAWTWLEELEGRVRAGVLMTSALREYLDAKLDLRPSTRAGYRRDVEHVYIPRFGLLAVRDVGLADLEAFLAELAAGGRAWKTRAKHLAWLRGFFAWSRRRRYCAGDPTDGLRVRRGEQRRAPVLTPAEAERLLAELLRVREVPMSSARRGEWTQRRRPLERLWLLVLVGLYTGLRRRNLVGLRWQHIDLAARRIRIPAAEMKGRRAFAVPIHRRLEAALRSELHGGGVVPAPGAYVLGRAARDLHRGLGAAAERAGLPRLGWQSLRRTFATWIDSAVVRGEVSGYALAALLGHAARTVTGRYVDVDDARLEAAIARLPDLELRRPQAAEA